MKDSTGQCVHVSVPGLIEHQAQKNVEITWKVGLCRGYIYRVSATYGPKLLPISNVPIPLRQEIPTGFSVEPQRFVKRIWVKAAAGLIHMGKVD